MDFNEIITRLPKPYYLDNQTDIAIYCGDCREILPQLPDNSVDLVLTDPPFNVSQDGVEIDRRNFKLAVYRRQANIKKDFGAWDKLADDDYFALTESWFSLCVKKLQDGSWLCSFFDKLKTGYFDLILAPKYGMRSKTILVWLKTNPTPNITKANFTSASEFIWCGVKGSGKIVNFGLQNEMFNYFLYPNASIYGITDHPTEKPSYILDRLVGYLSNNGDVILDPFLGSGTTCYCAKKLNRKCIGIEIEEKYCEIAAERCSQSVMRLEV